MRGQRWPSGARTTRASRTVNGILVQGTLTAADARGISFEQLLDEMRAGNAYVNVHTTQYPAGEIRGQTRLLQ